MSKELTEEWASGPMSSPTLTEPVLAAGRGEIVRVRRWRGRPGRKSASRSTRRAGLRRRQRRRGTGRRHG